MLDEIEFWLDEMLDEMSSMLDEVPSMLDEMLDEMSSMLDEMLSMLDEVWDEITSMLDELPSVLDEMLDEIGSMLDELFGGNALFIVPVPVKFENAAGTAKKHRLSEPADRMPLLLGDRSPAQDLGGRVLRGRGFVTQGQKV